MTKNDAVERAIETMKVVASHSNIPAHRARLYESIKSLQALQTSRPDVTFLPTTDYYDPEKLTTEQRAQYEQLIGSALIHAKTWAPSDKEYMAAKTGAHRAVIGLIKHGLLPPTSEGV